MSCVGEDNVKSGPLEGHLATDESGAIEAHSVQVETKWERRGRMERGRGRWERGGRNREWESEGRKRGRGKGEREGGEKERERKGRKRGRGRGEREGRRGKKRKE